MKEFQHPVINESDIPTYDPGTQSCTGFVNLKFNNENVYTRKLLSIDLVIDIDKNYTLDIVDENMHKISYDLVGTKTISVSPERLIFFYPVAQPEVFIWTPSNQIMKDWLQTLHVVTSLANLRAKGIKESRSMEDLTKLSEQYSGKLSFYPLRSARDKMTDVTASRVLMQHTDKRPNNSSLEPINYAVSLNGKSFASPKFWVPAQESPPQYELAESELLLLSPTSDIVGAVSERPRTFLKSNST